MKVKEYKGMYDKINTTAELDGKIIDSVVHMKKTPRRFKLAKVAVVAMMCIALSGGTAYAINYVRHMNEGVKEEIIQVDSQQKAEQYLIDNGFDVSYDTGKNKIEAANQGISVQLLETVSDKKVIYIYYKVDYGKWAEKLKSKGYDLQYADMDFSILGIDMKGKIHELSWGMDQDVERYTGKQGVYRCVVYNEKNIDIKQIVFRIDSFGVDRGKLSNPSEYIFAKGKWELKWNLKYGIKRVKKVVNREINLGKKYNNAEILVKEIVITPLSYVINYTCDTKDEAIWKCYNQLGGILSYHWRLNKGPIKVGYSSKELDPNVLNTIEITPLDGEREGKFIGFTGVIGDIEKIDYIKFSGENIIHIK